MYGVIHLLSATEVKLEFHFVHLAAGDNWALCFAVWSNTNQIKDI